MPRPFLNALTVRVALAPAETARAGGDTTPVLETVTFRVAPGVSDSALLAAARATGAPLRARPGFVSRSLVQGEDGQWTDLVLWSSLPEALAAAKV